MKLAELQLNDTLPVKVWQPTDIQLRQYAEASGDFNPIHLDNTFAEKAGLGSVIAHGMLTMAQLGALLTDWIGSEGSLKHFEVRFQGMVRPGDKVKFSGHIQEKNPSELTCRIWAKKNDSEEVLSGTAIITLKP